MLKSFDTGDYALTLMDDFKLKQLPLVEGNLYKALISEKELLALNNIFTPLQTLVETSESAPFIQPNQPILDALALLVRLKLEILPVCNAKRNYLGVVTLEAVAKNLAELSGAETPGSIIILEIKSTDYALSDIARILESNQAHLLSLLSTPQDETGKIRLMLKIDLEDASPVIRSFERFDYNVLFYFMKQGMIDDVFQRRINELFHYMNI